MIYFQAGSEKTVLGSGDLKKGLFIALEKLAQEKKFSRCLRISPGSIQRLGK